MVPTSGYGLIVTYKVKVYIDTANLCLFLTSVAKNVAKNVAMKKD